MASVYTNNYDIYFATRDDAMDVLEEARNKALDLGNVTLSEIKKLAGMRAEYLDYRTWWTYDSLRHTGVAKLREGYGIMLPPPPSNGPKITYREYQPSNRYVPISTPKSTPKALTIAVDSNVDDFDEVLANVFKYAQTITDREVQIDIT